MRTELSFSNPFAQTNRNARLESTFAAVLNRVQAAHRTHLGYPYNLTFSPGVPALLGGYLINNLGDP